MIHTGLDQGVLTLTIDRSDKKNALTNDMYGTLADAIAGAADEAAVRVIVIRAEGDLFTAGNDLGEFASVAAGKAVGPRHVGRFLEAISMFPKPIVAAVQGKAVGVGTTMLMHCDYVILAEDAQLTTPFVGLALVPEAASSLLLTQRIGHVRAFGMFALGEPLYAADALAWGVANRVVATTELPEVAARIARRLTHQPPGALRATKHLMRDRQAISAAMAEEGAEFLARLTSAEAREAFTAFSEKRPPVFTDAA